MSVTSDDLLRQIILALGGDPDDATPETINRISVATATIANGASLSDVADLNGGKLVGLIMPAAWTAAALSFDVSADGSTYAAVFDGSTERAFTSGEMAAQVGRFASLNPNEWGGVKSLKLRSGLVGAVTNQGAARAFTVVIQKGL